MDITIGRQVYVSLDGPGYAPGIVVAINDDDTVNARVFYDSPQTGYLTRVPLYPTEAAARAELAKPDPATGRTSAAVAWVPAGDAERDAAVAAMHALFTAEQLDTPQDEAGRAAQGEPTAVPV